jgi:hypothetical protein
MHPITDESKQAKRRPLVTLTARETAAAINESYQTPSRVESYVATQDLVVPKEALFEKVIEVLMNETAPARRAIRILEPGMGPAAFTRFVLRQPFIDRFDDISVQGADISHGMLVYATEVIHALYQSNINGQRVTIALTSGINCFNGADPFYGEIRSQGKRFDAIIASQFEHYCPNSQGSVLARRYRELGIPYSTKSEFRRLCYDLLEDGGIYFTIDDRLGESPEEHERICRAWDGHVVRQFTDDGVLHRLQSSHPALARNLRLNYDPQRPRETLLYVAAKAREYRRETCREEIEPLSVTRRDFVNVFGEENVYCMMHPSIETHPGFYLMWAFKRN